MRLGIRGICRRRYGSRAGYRQVGNLPHVAPEGKDKNYFQSAVKMLNSYLPVAL
jgi:hypothetical protein